MKQADIQDRCRYIAKVNGERTIVQAFLTRGGLRFRDERSNRFVSLTARRLWRPALDNEHFDGATVQRFHYHQHRTMVEDGRVYLPVVEWEDEEPDVAPSHEPIDDAEVVALAMYKLRLAEGRSRLALAGC